MSVAGRTDGRTESSWQPCKVTSEFCGSNIPVLGHSVFRFQGVCLASFFDYREVVVEVIGH